MKKFWFFLVTILFSSIIVLGQSSPKITFKDTNKKYSFGTVKEGEIVTYEYEFTNTGTAPIVIFSAETTCGCTKAEISKAPVMPGKSGKIKVTFDSAGKPGVTEREIYVKCNVAPENSKTSYHVLTLVGNVKGK